MKSILILVNWKADIITRMPVNGENSEHDAWTLWEAIKGDWPGYTPYVISDDEAAQRLADKPRKPNKIARVIAYAGRLHLMVADIPLATQGDLCRDENRTARCWDEDMLIKAAGKINRLSGVECGSNEL